MAELSGKPFHVARCELRIGGTPIAVGMDFNYQRTAMVAEVRVTNRLHRADAVTTGYTHTISLRHVKAIGAGLVALGLVPSVGGTHEQQLTAALEFSGQKNLDVYDSVTGEKVYECQGVTPTSIGENTSQGTFSQGSWSATCDRVLMEGEM